MAMRRNHSDHRPLPERGCVPDARTRQAVLYLIEVAKILALQQAGGETGNADCRRAEARLDRTVDGLRPETLQAITDAIGDDRRVFLDRLRPHLERLATMEVLDTADAMVRWLVSPNRPI